jgi:hypothetical protein
MIIARIKSFYQRKKSKSSGSWPSKLISLRLRLVRTKVRYQLIENRGALIRDHESGELKKANKKILTGTSVPLDTCLLMGRPGGYPAGNLSQRAAIISGFFSSTSSKRWAA